MGGTEGPELRKWLRSFKKRLPIDIRKELQKAQRIKLPGGVVGKVSGVLIVACIAISTIGYVSNNDWIRGGALVAIVALVFPLLWKLIGFANKNPQAAILEGAEFLVHEQIKMASKHNPDIHVDLRNLLPAKPINPSPAEIAAAQQPDSISTAILEKT